MKVVGIDPGTAACGYGIVHESGGRLRAVGHGCWSTPAGQAPELRLKTIYDGVAGLVADSEADQRPLDPDRTEVTLSGNYRPPLGRAGQVLDDALLARVARSTVRSLLRRFARALEEG